MSFRRWVLPAGCLMLGGLAGVALGGRAESLPDPVIAGRPTDISAVSTVPATAQPTTTTGPAAPTTSASVASSTAPPSTTSPASADRAVVVVANGTATSGVAAAAAAVLRGSGWRFVFTDDVAGSTSPTGVYADPEWQDTASSVVADLGLLAAVAPLRDAPPLRGDATGDVIVVIGPEAVG